MRLLTVLVLTLAVGCTRDAGQAPAQASAPSFAPPAQAATSAGSLTGRVLETMDAATYTYLRLSTATGEQWAAIPTTAVTVGSEVTLTKPMVMKNFASKTLNRTFEEILFSPGIEGMRPAAPHAEVAKAAPAAAAPKAGEPGFEALSNWAETQAGGPAKAAPAGMPPPAAIAPVTGVAKATGPGAATVVEIYQQKAALLDKPVLLRGKVVKYTSGVLGKNWLHLRDGSGTEDGKDNDIAVTTTQTVALGDVVVVQGPVHLARDFGAGYFFPVMIEDAKIVR